MRAVRSKTYKLQNVNEMKSEVGTRVKERERERGS